MPTRTEMPSGVMSGCRAEFNESGREDSTDTREIGPAAEAQGICLRLLTARPRSRAELADALRRRGIPEEVGEPVLDRLSQVGLVDDVAFAESAVRSAHRHRGLGRRALRTELRRRGVQNEIMDRAVGAVRPEDEEQRARELVQRKLRTSTVRDATALARKLGAMLARKGYSEGLAWRVVRDELGRDGLPPELESCPD
ncbi:MAG: recombination regulator RecX [Pseudonocardiales bacterium]|nr:MAG: recombination regulator RecX [Pseudonocardiales bacterium]